MVILMRERENGREGGEGGERERDGPEGYIGYIPYKLMDKDKYSDTDRTTER